MALSSTPQTASPATPQQSRQLGRSARRNLSPARRRLATNRLNKRLCYQLKNAQRVALFLHFDGEPDLLACMTQLLKRRRQIYIPLLQRDQLHFVSYRALRRARINRYGIIEPHNKAARLSSKRLQAVVMPLTAYDTLGTRVGMGAGYYDRNLQWRQQRMHWQGPQLLGAAWQCQAMKHITREAWDIPMNKLVNEQHTLVFRKQP